MHWRCDDVGWKAGKHTVMRVQEPCLLGVSDDVCTRDGPPLAMTCKPEGQLPARLHRGVMLRHVMTLRRLNRSWQGHLACASLHTFHNYYSRSSRRVQGHGNLLLLLLLLLSGIQTLPLPHPLCRLATLRCIADIRTRKSRHLEEPP
jgi:hypothetical protein